MSYRANKRFASTRKVCGYKLSNVDNYVQ